MREALPLPDAAKHLNVSQQALHKRLRRGSLQGYKQDGRWFVWVDTEIDGGQDTDRDADRTGQRVDAGTTHDDSSMTDLYERLIEQQNERITFLEDQVRALNQIVYTQAQRLALPEPEPEPEPEPLSWWRRLFG